MPRDPVAAIEQVRAARASVDDARRGNRDLAARFRECPSPTNSPRRRPAARRRPHGRPARRHGRRPRPGRRARTGRARVHHERAQARRRGLGIPLPRRHQGAWVLVVETTPAARPRPWATGRGCPASPTAWERSGERWMPPASTTVPPDRPRARGGRRMIRVLIADDEDMIRTALAALLRLEDDLEVVAECRDGESALAEAERLRPDVCLLDLEMPGLDGVDTARAHPPPRAVAVRDRHAARATRRAATRARCGVDGFLPKSRPADDVAAVIREVAAGRRYVDPEIAADALSDERSPLTDRELDVLRAGRGARRSPRSRRPCTCHPGPCAITCRRCSASSGWRAVSRRRSMRGSGGGSDGRRG